MAAERIPIRSGGLMRCCVATIHGYQGDEKEGTVLPCQWCSDSMIVKNGAWQWNRDFALSGPTS